MDIIDLEDLDRPRERWVELGKVGFLVRYVTPHQAEQMRIRLTRAGVLRSGGRNGGPDVAPGRDLDMYRELARTYVVGWRGIRIGGELDPPYDADRMAELMSKVGPVLDAIKGAITDDSDFFGPAAGT